MGSTLKETERIMELIDLLVASEKVPTDIKLLLLEELKGEIIVETGMKVTQGREDIWHCRQLTEIQIYCDPLRETLLRHRKIQAHN